MQLWEKNNLCQSSDYSYFLIIWLDRRPICFPCQSRRGAKKPKMAKAVIMLNLLLLQMRNRELCLLRTLHHSNQGARSAISHFTGRDVCSRTLAQKRGGVKSSKAAAPGAEG